MPSGRAAARTARRATGFFDRRSPPPDDAGYRRVLGPIDLVGIGVAAIIGAGIFVFLGNEARVTGPAVMLSLVVAGGACILAALSYAEAASIVPSSGSAYSFAWLAFGRFPAFLMGWLFLNAYAIGNAGVAAGWKDYFVGLLSEAGWSLPDALLLVPTQGGALNLPAVLVMLLVTALTVVGVRSSTWINNALVAMKLGLVLVVILAGVAFVQADNFTPFAPGGLDAVVASTAVLVFAYLGFDTVAAAGAEARDPRRDLPKGILASVGVCTLLYVAMAAVVTGLDAPADPDDPRPLIVAKLAGAGLGWAGLIVTVGALLGLVTVAYAFQLAMARILQAMAEDGFAPASLAPVAANGIPVRATLVVGAVTAAAAAFVALDDLIDMAVVASIAIYVLVSLGILAVRRRPGTPRPTVRVHGAFHVASALVLTAIAAFGIGPFIHVVFLAWMALGLVVYGFWAHRASAARRPHSSAE